MKHTLALLILSTSLSGCISFDKERAAEHRKNELCRKLETQHLPHCAGNHVPPAPVN